MIRHALTLLVTGSLLGALFATWLGPRPARGEDAPAELVREPVAPTRDAKDISRPIIEATRKVRPGVVQITNFRRARNGRLYSYNTGSGFIISKEGHVLTNRHVINGAAWVLIELADGRRFEKTKVMGEDPRSDVAVVKIEQTPRRPLPVVALGDSDALEVGEIVVAIGAPHRLSSSVSMGIVSATGRTNVLGGATSEEFIQTDAALNPGNSGGPLINLDGQVVGINTAIDPRARGGIGFAIPSNLARTIAISLIERGIARRGWLGIAPKRDPRSGDEILSSSVLRSAGIEARGGISVRTVEPGSPAEAAGIRVDDIITAVDGKPLVDMGILHARLAQAGPGGTMKLTVHNSSGTRVVTARLGEERIQSYGLEVATLDQKRARSLGLPAQTQGAVVTRVQDDSLAARADTENRLLPGDVIERIDWPGGSRVIKGQRDFEQLMTEFQARTPPLIQFIIRTKEGRYRVQLRLPRG